jgi:hypothetical protein
MNPFKAKTAATPTSSEATAVEGAEAALLEARHAASRAAEAVAAAEADAAQARAALAAVEAAEALRPAQERQARALARVAEIDGALLAALEWLSSVLKERHELGGVSYSASRLLGRFDQLPSPSVEPHSVTAGRPGSADIHVSWPK